MDHQVITTWRGGAVEELQLPSADVEIMRGVRWGKFDEFFTPAFWVSRAWIDGESSGFTNYSIGRSLREEVAACLLGGHGMPAELGLAAFRRLRDRGLLDGLRGESEIEAALAEPLEVRGRNVRYRYPRRKARFVARAMRRVTVDAAPTRSGKELRDWLMTFRGIGPKTASWIARNTLHADDVAILDVHVVRAGLLMGLFSPRYSVQKDYFDMEARLVRFAEAIGVKLSKFDSMIWCYMRQWNRMALDALSGKGLNGNCP
jgi:thermostable 8-oxoguanine DNA glycosylase